MRYSRDSIVARKPFIGEVMSWRNVHLLHRYDQLARAAENRAARTAVRLRQLVSLYTALQTVRLMVALLADHDVPRQAELARLDRLDREVKRAHRQGFPAVESGRGEHGDSLYGV